MVDRLADAFRIARYAVSVARQSALVGISLSVVAMGFAAVGLLPPFRARCCKRRSTWS